MIHSGRGSFFCLFGKIVGCALVDEVVQPIGEQQVGVTAPADHGRTGVIVIGEVVLGDANWLAQIFVADIFFFQGFGIVFRVSGKEDLSATFREDGEDPGFFGAGGNF